MNFSSLSQQQAQNNAKEVKQIYIGLLNPSITKDLLMEYFQNSNLKLKFPRKKFKKSRNYMVAKTSDPYTFEFLSQTQQQHKIGESFFITEEFLTGEAKIAKDIQEAKKKIYIGNLPEKANNEDLNDFFSRFGPIKTGYISRKKSKAKKVKIFGFVTFENQSSAQAAVKLENLYLYGLRLLVKPFISKWSKATDDGKNEDKIPKNLDVRQIIHVQSGTFRYSMKYSNELFQKSRKDDERISKFIRITKSHDDKKLIEFVRLKHRLESWNLVLNEGIKR